MVHGYRSAHSASTGIYPCSDIMVDGTMTCPLGDTISVGEISERDDPQKERRVRFAGNFSPIFDRKICHFQIKKKTFGDWK